MTGDERRAEEQALIARIRHHCAHLPEHWGQWSVQDAIAYKKECGAALAYTWRDVVTLETLTKHASKVDRWYSARPAKQMELV